MESLVDPAGPLQALAAGFPPLPREARCYAWLALDERGNWLIQGKRVSHPGMREFFARHYRVDAAQGFWYVHNGRQQVVVKLTATPWILTLEDGGLLTHTGKHFCADHAWVDESGRVYASAGAQIGLLRSGELAALDLEDGATLRLPAAGQSGFIALGGTRLPLDELDSHTLETRFAFVRDPQAD